jgi:hypothetical protein
MSGDREGRHLLGRVAEPLGRDPVDPADSPVLVDEVVRVARVLAEQLEPHQVGLGPLALLDVLERHGEAAIGRRVGTHLQPGAEQGRARLPGACRPPPHRALEGAADVRVPRLGERLPEVAPQQLVPRAPPVALRGRVHVREAPARVERQEGVADALQRLRGAGAGRVRRRERGAELELAPRRRAELSQQLDLFGRPLARRGVDHAQRADGVLSQGQGHAQVGGHPEAPHRRHLAVHGIRRGVRDDQRRLAGALGERVVAERRAGELALRRQRLAEADGAHVEVAPFVDERDERGRGPEHARGERTTRSNASGAAASSSPVLRTAASRAGSRSDGNGSELRAAASIGGTSFSVGLADAGPPGSGSAPRSWSTLTLRSAPVVTLRRRCVHGTVRPFHASGGSGGLGGAGPVQTTGRQWCAPPGHAGSGRALPDRDPPVR